ncbi:MAG: hypothetical protein R3F20_00685 [Planctomycetota bacterium]
MRSGYRSTTWVLLAAFALGACVSERRGRMRAEAYKTPPYALPVTASWHDDVPRWCCSATPRTNATRSS